MAAWVLLGSSVKEKVDMATALKLYPRRYNSITSKDPAITKRSRFRVTAPTDPAGNPSHSVLTRKDGEPLREHLAFLPRLMHNANNTDEEVADLC